MQIYSTHLFCPNNKFHFLCLKWVNLFYPNNKFCIVNNNRKHSEWVRCFGQRESFKYYKYWISHMVSEKK